MLLHHYGIRGKLSPLSSEVERTYAVSDTGRGRLILKTSAKAATLESFRFQSDVLACLERSEGVAVPRVIRTVDDALLFEHDETVGYLQTCIEGTPLDRLEPSPQLLRNLGAALARLNLALVRIAPGSARRPVLWNLACWGGLMALHRYLPAGSTAEHVGAAMAHYASHVAPRLEEVDWQVTHNDPSPFNMISAGSGIAFIDFGDGGWNPRVQDLAIAAGHFVSDVDLPLGGAAHVIAGYNSVLPLSEVEMEILAGLMRARQSALILINHWRSHLFPDASRYIMKNVHRAETGLALLSRFEPGMDACAVKDALALGGK
jgi:Ser/Thr protein kinase RdoA (MazF antagonist)